MKEHAKAAIALIVLGVSVFVSVQVTHTTFGIGGAVALSLAWILLATIALSTGRPIR
jgi:hypothetical protein